MHTSTMQPQQRRTRIWLLAIVLLAGLLFNLEHSIDQQGKQYIDQAFKRALITFGIAKTLNGVISVAQGTEVAIQPAGIGINLTPGEILDPVNDLVERFSWIMLASTTSLGIQKIFLTISEWTYFRYGLALLLSAALLLLFYQARKYNALRIALLRLSLLMIVLRFMVPLAGIGNEMVYQAFLQQDYQNSRQVLQTTSDNIHQLNQQQRQPDIKKKSVWESARDFYQSTSEMLDINKKIEHYKQIAAQATQHIVELIVIFVFQTVILPLLFIIGIYLLLKKINRIEFDQLLQ